MVGEKTSAQAAEAGAAARLEATGHAPARAGYHHGDLQQTLLALAMQRVEAGEPIALRAIAKEAGVTATATYRHYANKQALESAVAAAGYRAMTAAMRAAQPDPLTRENVWEVAAAYVDYALDHPSLFGLMMSTPCAELPEDGAPVDELNECIAAAVLPLWAEEYSTEAERNSLFFALWSWIHGAAMLHLEGKVESTDREAVHRRIRDSWQIMGLAR